jgi:hypothetical protein
LKPFFCALYPVYVENDEVIIDHETEIDFEGANCRRFCATKQPLYRVFREEMKLVLGEDGYRELEAQAATSTTATGKD